MTPSTLRGRLRGQNTEEKKSDQTPVSRPPPGARGVESTPVRVPTPRKATSTRAAAGAAGAAARSRVGRRRRDTPLAPVSALVAIDVTCVSSIYSLNCITVITVSTTRCIHKT